MKVQGGSSGPIDLIAKKSVKSKELETSEPKKKSSDRVDTQISQSLQNIESAIQSSDLNLGDLHSHLDEGRLQKLFDSFDRVESKRPEIDPDQVLQLAERVAEKMKAEPKASVATFRDIEPQRAAELLS